MFLQKGPELIVSTYNDCIKSIHVTSSFYTYLFSILIEPLPFDLTAPCTKGGYPF